MNQRYTSDAVLDDGSGPEEWVRDQALHAQHTTRPGAKLPHSWLVAPDGHRISTLDVVADDRLTLVTDLAGTAWVEAAAAIGDRLAVVVIGDDAHRDLYYTWHDAAGLDEGSALLVRPDRVVAWRHPGPAESATAPELLADAASRILQIDLRGVSV
jgi:2,4-dichlorophenol 6-monooxygenase